MSISPTVLRRIASAITPTPASEGDVSTRPDVVALQSALDEALGENPKVKMNEIVKDALDKESKLQDKAFHDWYLQELEMRFGQEMFEMVAKGDATATTTKEEVGRMMHVLLETGKSCHVMDKEAKMAAMVGDDDDKKRQKKKRKHR